MDVIFDVSALPLTDDEINAILSAREPRDENISVPTSVAFGEEKRFVMYGDTQEYKEYESAQAMIQDQPPLPDPVFEPGDFVPCTYDTGASLSRLDSYAAEFTGLIEQMFAAGPQLKLTKEGMEQLIAVKNE
uniref:Uncharacterized protein n=1 Tax=viral metagenome TaxID=1070528 RepID=A0A6C0EMQ0_9ZZZZ